MPCQDIIRIFIDRFTYDGVKYLTKDFNHVEIENVRGAVATLANLVPLFSKREAAFHWIDKFFNKCRSKQTSGYNVFCIK